MAVDYRQLWTDAVSANNKPQAVQTLSDILVNNEGRAFLSRLDSKDARLCVEILDSVSRDLYSPHSSLPQTVSLGYCRTQLQSGRGAGSFDHLENAQ